MTAHDIVITPHWTEYGKHWTATCRRTGRWLGVAVDSREKLMASVMEGQRNTPWTPCERVS